MRFDHETKSEFSWDVSLSNHRYHELDALRAVAAIGVICWHYINTYHSAPFEHVLAPFYARGLLMVDFFFVLSGFVLARAFWINARAPQFAGNVRARIARLYPLHFITLCTVAIMQWYLIAGLGRTPFTYSNNDGYHLVLNLVLLQSSGLQHGFSFNAPSWSISTEFLVNLLFLGAIAAPRKIVLPLCWLITIASLATMLARGVINDVPAFGWISNDLIRTTAGFFVGVLIFRLHRRIGEKGPSVALDIASLILFLIAIAYLASNRWSTLGDVLLCYFIYPAAILCVIRSYIIRAVLRMRPMVYLGEISYSIYLVHFPLLLGIFILSSVTGVAVPANSHFYFIGFLLATVIVASVTYRWIEMPARDHLVSSPVKRTLQK